MLNGRFMQGLRNIGKTIFNTMGFGNNQTQSIFGGNQSAFAYGTSTGQSFIGSRLGGDFGRHGRNTSSRRLKTARRDRKLHNQPGSRSAI